MVYFIPFIVSGILEFLYMLGVKAPKVKTDKSPIYFGLWKSRT